jgi:hypothetical protein
MTLTLCKVAHKHSRAPLPPQCPQVEGNFVDPKMGGLPVSLAAANAGAEDRAQLLRAPNAEDPLTQQTAPAEEIQHAQPLVRVYHGST